MQLEIKPGSAVKQAFLFPAILFLALLLWHGPLVWTGQVLCGGDLVNNFIPTREAQRHSGWFAGWQDDTFSGRPLLDDIQTGAFYPANWLHLTGIAPERVITILAMLHLLLGGWGFALFARERFSFFPSLLAGLLWSFSGYQILRLAIGVQVFTAAFAWMPWMWLAAERQSLVKGRGLFWCGALALFGALQLSAGAPQVVQITWGGLALWTLGRLLLPRAVEPRPRILFGFLLAGVLAILANAPMLTAAMRLQAEAAERTTGDLLQYLTDGSILPRLMVAWLFPNFYAPGLDEKYYWGSTVGYAESNIYLGILPLMLAVYTLLSWRRVLAADGSRDDRRTAKRWLLTLLSAAVLGVLIALGSHGFLFEWLVRLVPTFKLFRVPARWLVWTVCGVALLACWGLELMLSARAAGEPARPQLLRWGLVAALFLLGVIILRATLRGALSRLGFDDFLSAMPPAFAVEFDEILTAFAAGSVNRALVMTAIGALAVVALHMGRPRPLLGPCAVVIALSIDLYTYWTPFATPYPAGIPGPDIESEAPYHRIDASRFRDAFYPQTPLIDALQQRAPLGRIHYNDTLLAYQFDQFQREILNERPIVHQLPMTRGYQQLHLAGYVDDYAASLPLSIPETPGAFLGQIGARDRRFLDAYNVATVLTQPYPALDNDFAALGLRPIGPIGGIGAVAWSNPGARGWAWLSENPTFLDASPSPECGEVRITRREAEHWHATASITKPAYIHFSAPPYAAWEITATKDDGTIIDAIDSRTVFLPTPGTWTIDRTFYSIGLKPSNIALSLIALTLMIAAMARGRMAEDSKP